MQYELIASLVSDQLVSVADWNIVTYSVDGLLRNHNRFFLPGMFKTSHPDMLKTFRLI